MVLVVMMEKREIKDNGRERSENSYKNILQVAVPVPVPVLLHVHGDVVRVFFLYVGLGLRRVRIYCTYIILEKRKKKKVV